jgi:NTE family protein
MSEMGRNPSRLAADPVDLLIAPDVAHIGVMEFHHVEEAIQAGRKAVTSAQDAILAWRNQRS